MEEFYETLDEIEKKLREELKKMAKKPDISPVEVDNANKAGGCRNVSSLLIFGGTHYGLR